MEDGASVTFICSLKDRWGQALVALVQTHSSPYCCRKLQVASNTLLMSSCAVLGPCNLAPLGGFCVLSQSWHHHHVQWGVQQLSSARAEPHKHGATHRRVGLMVGLCQRKILCHSGCLGP